MAEGKGGGNGRILEGRLYIYIYSWSDFSLNVLVPVQEKKRVVRQRYLPFLPCCLPGLAQAGYPRALGCIRVLVIGSPL